MNHSSPFKIINFHPPPHPRDPKFVFWTFYILVQLKIPFQLICMKISCIFNFKSNTFFKSTHSNSLGKCKVFICHAKTIHFQNFTKLGVKMTVLVGLKFWSGKNHLSLLKKNSLLCWCIWLYYLLFVEGLW